MGWKSVDMDGVQKSCLHVWGDGQVGEQVPVWTQTGFGVDRSSKGRNCQQTTRLVVNSWRSWETPEVSAGDDEWTCLTGDCEPVEGLLQTPAKEERWVNGSFLCEASRGVLTNLQVTDPSFEGTENVERTRQSGVAFWTSAISGD